MVWFFPQPGTRVVFCDVGQGDATLITQGFTQILIDGGPNDRVLDCLARRLPFFDHQLEVVALTHPEADHLTGLISVLDKYQADYFITGPVGNASAGFAALQEKIRGQKNMQIVNVYTGDKIQIGSLRLTALWPEKNWVAGKTAVLPQSRNRSILGATTTHRQLNDFSLVLLLKKEAATVLLMGDADSRVQDEMQSVNRLEPVDILKFPHHGSKTGIREEFLRAIKPKTAVISVGKNSFGHPTAEALQMLDKYRIEVRRTDKEGDVIISLD